ncbi:hypothetical protein [Solitalea lacus]|uniref:hypothetical protein n=1 Tax=Solitalea lacus TaxID=2911172 RepID=UPI001EDAC91C|nr:hypothetical protein [Solitalea lacus]UKJ07544.1 hypothetical protein L2B55_18755 [Solitalea lacus]
MSLKQQPYLCILVLAFIALSCKSSNDPIEEVKPQEPKIIYDLVNVKYSLSADDKVTLVPFPTYSRTMDNRSSIPQSLSINLSKDYNETSDFTNVDGFDMTRLERSKVGVPRFNGTQAEVGVLSLPKWTFGEKSELEREVEQTVTVEVPANSKVTANLMINMYKLSANYTATLKNKLNGEIKTISGKWYGLQSGEAQIEIKQ